jgi:hypothetical protein
MANTPLIDPDWPLIVVIEGAPLSGKTFLANLVLEGAQKTGSRAMIHRMTGKFQVRDYINVLTTVIPDGWTTIFDGFHFSATAAMHRRPFTFRDDVLAIERLLSSMQAIKIELVVSMSSLGARGLTPDDSRRLERWIPTGNLLQQFSLIEEPVVQRYTSLQNDEMHQAAEAAAAICKAIERMRSP